MNRFITGLILTILAAGVYFTFTAARYDKVKQLKVENEAYARAVEESNQLLREREAINTAYNKIKADDRERLNKLLPDHIDNIRLIIDINSIVAQRGVLVKNIKVGGNSLTASADPKAPAGMMPNQQPVAQAVSSKYDSLTLSFNVTTSYSNFITILRDLERSLRILDITGISFTPTETGIYDFNVELKTYWLRQK
jgi:hypothetical protein